MLSADSWIGLTGLGINFVAIQHFEHCVAEKRSVESVGLGLMVGSVFALEEQLDEQLEALLEGLIEFVRIVALVVGFVEAEAVDFAIEGF